MGVFEAVIKSSASYLMILISVHATQKMIIFVTVRQSRMKYCSVLYALVPVLRMDHCTEVVYSCMRLFSLSVTLTLPLTTLMPA